MKNIKNPSRFSPPMTTLEVHQHKTLMELLEELMRSLRKA